ncbi:hypothetical protein B0H13DRAFT_1873370 [Mycena leptocephala]|nr:hypothetical protein B0H13DRAFT_1873370 [Mycena leptocephala]
MLRKRDQDDCLDGGLTGNTLIGVNAFVGLPAVEEVGHAYDETGRASKEDDLVLFDVSILESRRTFLRARDSCGTSPPVLLEAWLAGWAPFQIKRSVEERESDPAMIKWRIVGNAVSGPSQIDRVPQSIQGESLITDCLRDRERLYSEGRDCVCARVEQEPSMTISVARIECEVGQNLFMQCGDSLGTNPIQVHEYIPRNTPDVWQSELARHLGYL